MKILTHAFLAAFLAITPLYAAENLLKNPGFESNDGPRSKVVDYWLMNAKDSFEVWDLEQETRSGSASAKFWWVGNLSQQVQAEPGTEYELTAWVLNPKSEPLDPNGTKYGLIRIEFISAGNITVGSKESEIFNCKAETGTWFQLKARETAPPNAAYVRAVLEFKSGMKGGTACFDDVELKATGKPAVGNDKFSLDLQGEWLMQTGDNMSWAEPGHGDANWKKITVPAAWERFYNEYDGFGWYRKHVSVPSGLKGESLYFVAGSIDDADETYFNGHLIGAGGRIKPEFQTAWNLYRQYHIPPEFINYAGDNVIAVRIFDNMGDGGITNRPVRIFNTAGLKFYLEENGQNDMKLGAPLTHGELKLAKEKTAGVKPSRPTVQRLPNGGWTFMTPEGKPFFPRGIEYEPLSIYGDFELEGIKRDIDLIKEAGFNTFTVWCIGFHAIQGTGGRHLTIDEMVKLAELAKERGLYIQFYLNIDRFTHLFPKATLPNGKFHHFDIDYFDPGYLAFNKNFAKRLAYALLPYNNVSTIVVWEEKWAMNETFKTGDPKIYVDSLYGSKAGKDAFRNWLKARHGGISGLNKAWGTSYKTIDEAIDYSLIQYQEGVLEDDHRQYDILEFGTIMLIDLTKDFVDAYKSVDPKMLFQVRNFDLFGPIRAVDPRYSFLDTFGINQYSLGNNGYDITLREEIVKMKLISGVAGIPPYVSNFGFRTVTDDGGTHGLVPDDRIKAQIAADSTALWSFLPEFMGTSYFMYQYMGWEGLWNVVERDTKTPYPIFYSFKSMNALLEKCHERFAASDYAEKARVYVFQGLDAFYEIYQKTWLEHTSMSWDLTDMDINYGVICDNDSFSPAERPVIIANFRVYEKKLDGETARKLLDYAKKGGNLVIGNSFGMHDRYFRPNKMLGKQLGDARGIFISGVKKGKVKVLASKTGFNAPDFEVKNTYYVEGDISTLSKSAEVLMTMETGGKTLPALVRTRYGKGFVYYLLYNPYLQEFWIDLKKESRTSLVSLHVIFSAMGIKHDVENLGNRGFQLKDGRINVREKDIHYLSNKEFAKLGKYKDEYGLDSEHYSGGVITDYFLSFHGGKLNERGWKIDASTSTSIGACVSGNELDFFTTDPVSLKISKDAIKAELATERYKLFKQTK